MQLTKTLEVTPEELFDALAGSIMQDIENATGKCPSRNKLNGYKYEKRPYRKRQGDSSSETVNTSGFESVANSPTKNVVGSAK